MNTPLKALVMVFALLMALGARAESLSIAVVDVAGVFAELPERDKIAQELREQFGGQERALAQREQQLQQRYEDLQREMPTMTESQQQEAGRNFQRQAMELEQSREQLQQQVGREQNRRRNELLERIQKAIDEVAEAEGLSLVIEGSAVAFAVDALDITDKVIAKMK